MPQHIIERQTQHSSATISKIFLKNFSQRKKLVQNQQCFYDDQQKSSSIVFLKSIIKIGSYKIYSKNKCLDKSKLTEKLLKKNRNNPHDP